MNQPHAKGADIEMGLNASSFQSPLMHNPKAIEGGCGAFMAFG